MDNKIGIANLETKQQYPFFNGVFLKTCIYNKSRASWSHVKEIPNTRFLVSVQHANEFGANMRIFDISQKGEAKTIYSFEEIRAGN